MKIMTGPQENIRGVANQGQRNANTSSSHSAIFGSEIVGASNPEFGTLV